MDRAPPCRNVLCPIAFLPAIGSDEEKTDRAAPVERGVRHSMPLPEPAGAGGKEGRTDGDSQKVPAMTFHARIGAGSAALVVATRLHGTRFPVSRTRCCLPDPASFHRLWLPGGSTGPIRPPGGFPGCLRRAVSASWQPEMRRHRCGPVPGPAQTSRRGFLQLPPLRRNPAGRPPRQMAGVSGPATIRFAPATRHGTAMDAGCGD